jgi:leader peptidase (prepilin peptidase)/N-methyltransferase
MTLDWLATASLIDIGAIVVAPFVGSFLATLVIRLPEHRHLWGRSSCPLCGATLAPWDLVPLLSWLVNRGRCRHCGKPVGGFYPLIELAALGIALWAASVFDGWRLWALCGLGWTLLTLAVIDVRHFLLPNVLTLPLTPAGLAVAWIDGSAALVDAAIGALAGLAVFAAAAAVYRRLRGREGLGLGDVKLLTASGAWVSWYGLPSLVLVASLGALLVTVGRAVRSGRLDPAAPVPYGAYLAFATWLVALYGPVFP